MDDLSPCPDGPLIAPGPRRSALVISDPLGLLAYSGENSFVAWRGRGGCGYRVQSFGHVGLCGPSPDAPGGCLVNEAGCGHLPDVGLPADPLAQMGVGPYWLAGAVGQGKGGRREHVIQRREPDRRTVPVVQYGEILGMRVRVADGHVERRAAQEACYAAGLPEVSQQACEVTQCRSALFLVFQPGRRGGGLAAVLLVHTHRKIAVSRIVPVIAPYRQQGKTGDVEQFGLRYRQPAGGTGGR